MSINEVSPYSVGYNDGLAEAASRQSRSKALLGELYANLCRAADIIISEYPVHDHRYKEAEGWIMNSLADARRELNIKSPNVMSHRFDNGAAIGKYGGLICSAPLIEFPLNLNA